MALYKIVPKNPYYFWSVMSLIMQVSMLLWDGSLSVMNFELSNTLYQVSGGSLQTTFWLFKLAMLGSLCLIFFTIYLLYMSTL